MLKKIDKAKHFLAENVELFCCPVCRKKVELKGYTLSCVDNHQFDLSKKGTLYFLKHSIQTEYNKKMLTHRGRIIESGMYEPLMKEIYRLLPKDEPLVDVGCGEGGFLSRLMELGIKGPSVGFDLSKEGIYLASSHAVSAFWCVADLTNMPFADQSIQTILNIFTPSHYQEFARILKPDGEVIKVIPEQRYLQELRQAFYPDEKEKQSYSNQKVKEKFAASLHLIEEKRVTYVYEIPLENRLDLLEMSPLEWQVDPQRKLEVQQNPLEKITIDVMIVKGKRR